MKFLFPGMLWGLLLLSVPIIVHLFNLRRAKKVKFSNVRFLNVIKSSSSSKLVLKHYLSLLFRLLFVGFLVMGFAVPYMESNESAVEGGVVNTIYLDNSYSNSNLFGNDVSGFEKSITLISSLVEESDDTQRFRLITNETSAFGQRTPLVKERFLEKLSEVELTSHGIGFNSLVDKIRQFDERNIVHVFSDFQRRQYVNLELEDSLNSYVLVPTKYLSERNVFVDSLNLENASLEKGSRNTLNVLFRNSGNEDVNDLSIKLLINEAQISSNSIDLRANRGLGIQIDLGQIADSLNLCELSFEDYPVTFDNRFFFTLKKDDPISVLELGDQNNRMFSSLFASELFDFTFNSKQNIDFGKLQNSDLVILNELELSNQTLVTELQKFLGNGGSVFVVPSGKESAAQLQELIGARIDFDDQETLSIQQPDVLNPFFKDMFEGDPSDAIMPVSSSFLKWNGGEDLLSFTNGRPYLSVFNRGGGKVFLLSGALSENGNDFARNAMFLPVMYNIGFVSGSRSPFRLYHRLSDEVLSIPVQQQGLNDLYSLRKDGVEVIPEQRINDGVLYVTLRNLEIEPGFWELVLKDELIDVIAINHSKRESEIGQYTINDLREVAASYKNMSVLELKEGDTWSASSAKNEYEKNLWKYSLILALVFFFAEVLTLRFL